MDPNVQLWQIISSFANNLWSITTAGFEFLIRLKNGRNLESHKEHHKEVSIGSCHYCIFEDEYEKRMCRNCKRFPNGRLESDGRIRASLNVLAGPSTSISFSRPSAFHPVTPLSQTSLEMSTGASGAMV